MNFPVPPLFVLGAVTPSAFLGYGAGGTIGGSGSGNLADGWGWNVSFKFPYSLQEPVHRKILTATGSAAQIVQITLSPRASLALSMAPPPPYQGPGGSPPPPSSASGYVHLPEYACPIFLTSPNPFGRPDKGDGTNQFVYDNIIPGSIADQGHLFVEGTVQVAVASTDDIDWLLTPSSQIDCTFDAGLTQAGWMVNPGGHRWALNPNNSSSLGHLTLKG